MSDFKSRLFGNLTFLALFISSIMLMCKGRDLGFILLVASVAMIWTVPRGPTNRGGVK
jgi:hypothetical protein